MLCKIKILLEGRVLTNEELSHLLHMPAEVQDGRESLLTEYDPELGLPHPFLLPAVPKCSLPCLSSQNPRIHAVNLLPVISFVNRIYLPL